MEVTWMQRLFLCCFLAMIAFDRGLTRYADRYLISRSVTPEYSAQIRKRVESFCEWCGDDIEVSAVDCDIANEWLAELAESGMNPQTLDGYRRALLCVW